MSKKSKTKNEIKDETKDVNNKIVETIIRNIDDDSEIFSSDLLKLKKIKTLNRLTKYEKARIIGTRAAQIQNGMPAVFLKNGIHVDLPDEYKDVVKSSIDEAKLELMLKSSPLIIDRVLPSGKVDKRTVQELE